MEIIHKEISLYQTESKKIPYSKWYLSLRDKKKQNIIDARLARVRGGNLGDYSSVGQGVYEFRFAFSSGIRIYFGIDGRKIILLLCGGDKSSQKKDIPKAQEYWADYRRRKNESD